MPRLPSPTSSLPPVKRLAVHRSWLLAIALLACKHSGEEAEEEKPAAATVTCKPAEAAEIEDIVDVSGVIAPPPKLDAVVSSPVAGRIAQVLVEEGDHVEAGALLALIEDPALP